MSEKPSKRAWGLLPAILVLAMAAVLLGLGLNAFSQEDITVVRDSAFGERMRPPVPFYHDDHNDRAGLDCLDCHHDYADGEPTGDDSIGYECSDCHLSSQDKNTMPLVRIYHLSCKGCHIEQRAGPVMCSECHVK